MTETLVIGGIAAVGFGVVALGVLVWTRIHGYESALRRTSPAGRTDGPDANRDEGYSLARYQPMLRLFAREDEDFVRGYVDCPELIAQWERSQRRVVRLYLRELAADFQRLHREARVLVAQSPEQYAGLVPLLLQQQYTFWRALVWIELRLSLSGAGVPKISMEALVGAIEAMRREIARASVLA
jgi:hypothetical protein